VVLLDERMLIPQRTLQDYADFTRRLLTRTIENLHEQPSTRLKIKGHDAVQTRLSGRMDDVDVVYVHTVIETPTRYYQVVAWTLEERQGRNLPRLTEAVSSFQELTK
jgi:hypothetical protein